MAMDDWGNLTERDFAIPTVSVGQGQSRNGKPGFFNFSTGESVEKMEGVVLLQPVKKRKLFGELGSDKLLCWSDDYVNPSVKVENPVSKNCITCPLGKWGNNCGSDDAAVREPYIKKLNKDANNPICDDIMSLLMMTKDGVPFYLQLRGKNFTVAKNELLTQLRVLGAKSPYQQTFDMSIKQAGDTKKGVVYVVVFSNFSWTDKVLIEQAISLKTQVGQMVTDRQLESHSAPQLTHEATDDDEVPHPADNDGLPF